MEEDKTYLHVAVANSYDGREGFKTDGEADGDFGGYPYIGFLTNYSEYDIGNPEDYTWMFNNKSLIKDEELKEAQQAFDSFVVGQLGDPVGQPGTAYNGVHDEHII